MPLLLPSHANIQTTTTTTSSSKYINPTKLKSLIGGQNRQKETSTSTVQFNENLLYSDCISANTNNSNNSNTIDSNVPIVMKYNNNNSNNQAKQQAITLTRLTTSTIQNPPRLILPFNSSKSQASSSLNFKNKRSESISNLLPLKEAPNQPATSPSLIMNQKQTKKSNSQPKRRKSNSLSIMDYCNIINMNTNYQMLANFYDETESMTRLNISSKTRNNVTKSISVSDQMAALFGSSDCTCYLCKFRSQIENSLTRRLQYNIEITPNRNYTDFSTMKYTYSSPLSQLSTLKLFNLMNTDCSIYFPENQNKLNENAIINQSITALPNTPNQTYEPSKNTTSLPSIVNHCNEKSYQASPIINNNNSNQPAPTTAQNYMLSNSNNPPLYDLKYLYLIDCRLNKKKFEKSRILTAIHFTDLLNDVVYLSPPIDNYTIIVLYDDDGTYLTSSVNSPSSSITSSNLSFDQIKSQSINAFNSVSSNFDKDRQITNSDLLIGKIKSKINCSQNRTLHILSGGFEQFQAKFPFMCTNLEIRSTVDRHKYLTIYPNCVIENQIYIGSGIQAKNWKIIRDLKITHIVNCSIEHECVFQDEIKYLHVKIQDSHEENIYGILDKVYKFMQNAFESYYEELLRFNYKNPQESENNSRSSSVISSVTNLKSISSSNGLALLVKPKPQPPVIMIHCNLGISRSSSVLIAYLIKRYNMCLYAAFNYVKDKRLQIAPNYSFLRQLKQFEETNCIC